MGDVVVGPDCVPGCGIKILERLVGVFQDKTVAFFPSQPKVLIVGGQVENVCTEMNAKRSGTPVLDFDRKQNEGNPVFLFHDRNSGLEDQGRMGPDRTGRKEHGKGTNPDPQRKSYHLKS